MNIIKEEMGLIHKINPNIFGKDVIGIGLEKCPCGKLKEWNNNQWICNCGAKP